MIIQSIEKHKTHNKYQNWPYYSPPQQQQHPSENSYTSVNDQYQMSKLEYSMFLQNLPYKKGDLVCLASFDLSRLSENTHVTPHAIFLVHDVDEIHHFVRDWGTKTTGPYILTLMNHEGVVRNYKGGAKLYQKITNENLIPKVWKDYLNAHSNNQ